jgi:hypothetical protein
MPGLLSLATACCCDGGGGGGDRFGVSDHFRLVRRLGRGGEGEVWLAIPRPDPSSSASGDASVSSRNGAARACTAPTNYVALKLLRRGLTAWQVEAVTAGTHTFACAHAFARITSERSRMPPAPPALLPTTRRGAVLA